MCHYNRYMVELRWASVRAAQSDIKEDLHAAELKYTVLNVFNVMVLIIAACLLGLMSNTTLSNNSTQTHDLFRLYMIRSKQLFLNNWLWAWNIYLFEWLKFDWTTNRNMNNNGKGLLMSWPRYVEGTTSISRLMHKQTYLTFMNYYIINYYIDHRLPVCRQWHAMYTAFKFITNRLILHKVHKIKLHVHTVIYMIISPTCSTSASRDQHNKASRYIL